MPLNSPNEWIPLTPEQVTTLQQNTIQFSNTANWPQGIQSTPSPFPEPVHPEDDWDIQPTISPVIIRKTVNGPSLDRAFYLTLAEAFVQERANRKFTHGLLESAVLEAESKAAREGTSFYVFKCVGKIEYKKPEFKEREDDGS
jgi:hypothetical protein